MRRGLVARALGTDAWRILQHAESFLAISKEPAPPGGRAIRLTED